MCLQIFTSGLDVFDSTPLLDIKPYIKDLDLKNDANYGWLDDLDSNKEHLLLHIKGIPHEYCEGGIMCLSDVYLEEKKQDKLLIEEAKQVSADDETVHVRSLMGERKDLEGYYISEVDLIGNYMILKKKQGLRGDG